MEKFSQFLVEKEANVKMVTKEPYGQELIVDVHDVPPEFFYRKEIKHFAEKLCDEINMKKGPLYQWGTDAEEHTAKSGEGPIKADGISTIQFLYKSSIVIHALDEIQKVFINIFSCEDFSVDDALKFIEEYVGGKIVFSKNLTRG